jgi:basic membrane lipoprotein Med (substrate-binding protein (PBP1-ABC) superfamily)
MRLTAREREFLDASRRRRDEADVAEAARVAEQARLRRRARRGSFALGAALAAGVSLAVVTVLAAGGSETTARVAVVVADDPADVERDARQEQGLVRAERDFDLEIDRRRVAPGVAGSELARRDDDLVILGSDAAGSITADDLDPGTRYVFVQHNGAGFDELSNVTTYQWAHEQAGFLAGVAAATTTRDGTVGFLGASRTDGGQEEYRAGFEAGARSIDADITVLSVYLAEFGYGTEPYDAPEGAREVAGRLYGAGADVIFHAAGRSGVGVLEAASGLSSARRWAIGVGSELWQGATTRQRSQILMSIVYRFDAQVYRIVEKHLDGGFEPGAHRLTLDDEMISYVAHGEALSADARAELDWAIERIASGEIEPPTTPTGAVADATAWLEPGAASSRLGDVPVTFTVPDGWFTSVEGTVLKGEPEYGVLFWNPVDRIYTDSCPSTMVDPPPGPTVDDFAAAWADLPGFEATAPVEISVDGFAGKLVEFTVPDYDEGQCPYGEFMLMGDASGDGYWAQAPNGHHQLRILDVDGTRLVITSFWYPDTPPEDRAAIDEIIASIQIG